MVQENPTRNTFKDDNVNALVKTSNGENLVLYFSEKVQNIAAFAMLFWFSVTKQLFENGLGSPPSDQKYPRYPLVLKLNVTLAQLLRMVILYFFEWKNLSDDRRLYLHDSKCFFQDLMWIDSPIQNNC